MSIYEYFVSGDEQYKAKRAELNRLHADVIELAKSFLPTNLDNLTPSPDEEEPVLELNWVRVADPRESDPALAGQLDVMPVLSVGWIDDGSGFSSIPGFGEMKLIGKTPSGDESTIGIIQESFLFDGESRPLAKGSADAELFLSAAKAALEAQAKE